MASTKPPTRPVFARFYAWVSPRMEDEGMGALRAELLAGVSGRELYRVIRPGGELRFLEHVIADSPGLRRVQRAADATVWPLMAGGCHTARDPLLSIREAGFEITSMRRLRFPDSRVPVPAAPHVLGTARRPDR